MTRTESSIRQIDINANAYTARKSVRNKQFGCTQNCVITNHAQNTGTVVLVTKRGWEGERVRLVLMYRKCCRYLSRKTYYINISFWWKEIDNYSNYQEIVRNCILACLHLINTLCLCVSVCALNLLTFFHWFIAFINSCFSED